MKQSFILCAIGIICSICPIQADAQAKYIFYCIGDGMGTGHVSASQRYATEALGRQMLFTTLPVQGLSTTHSASSDVTDSAAAGTALASGSKTRNSMLGMNADTVAVQSIATTLSKQGWGVGLVTNVAPDDATPGAFYAHVPKRSMYYQIGTQAATSGFNFIGGSAWRGLTDKKGNPTDLTALFESNGWQTLYGDGDFESVTSDRVVMLGDRTDVTSNLGYTLEIEADSLPTLTLPRMTRACLSQLERVSPDRFFMMIEGGNIDWAGHANDGAAIIKETLAFDKAIKIAYDFYLAHPDETLIVVTADHETGGMALGNYFLNYEANLKLIDNQRVSKDTFNDQIEAMLRSRRIYDWDDIKTMLINDFGMWTAIPVTEAQTLALQEAFDKTFTNRGNRTETYYKSYSPLVMQVFKVLNDHYGIGFTTGNHSGNMVPVYAIGVGADRFTGVYDNTAIPGKLLEATK